MADVGATAPHRPPVVGRNEWGVEKRMPLVRYFAWVGSVLLALLFVADACFPELPVAKTTNTFPPAIRVHSDQKWPERVVYDTSAPIAGQPVAANPESSDSPKLREAMAELPTRDATLLASNPKRPEARPRQQYNIARKHTAKPMRFAARRSPFGWFAPAIW
jgi:hypothetical protein